MQFKIIILKFGLIKGSGKQKSLHLWLKSVGRQDTADLQFFSSLVHKNVEHKNWMLLFNV